MGSRRSRSLGCLTRRRFVRRIKPHFMNPFCYAVHGISLDELQKEPYFDRSFPSSSTSSGDIIVAHNSTYRYNTLKRGFERALAGLRSRAVYLHDGSRKAFGLPGKLRSACSHAGIRTDHLRDQHDALNNRLLAAHLLIEQNRRTRATAVVSGCSARYAHIPMP